MINRKLTTVIIAFLTLSSCKENKANVDLTITKKNSTEITLDSKAEIESWKHELIDSKLIGNPCNIDNPLFTRDSINKWIEENPNQMDGFPDVNHKIGVINSDFNEDGKQDLLLYMQAQNCTGHNGGVPTFAKIIYADGGTNNSLMQEIRLSIIKDYNTKRLIDKKLKEITDNYLETTTTIGYNKQIIGEFSLYTNQDAHCCPSYIGKYIYDIKNKKIKIQISEAN